MQGASFTYRMGKSERVHDLHDLKFLPRKEGTPIPLSLGRGQGMGDSRCVQSLEKVVVFYVALDILINQTRPKAIKNIDDGLGQNSFIYLESEIKN